MMMQEYFPERKKVSQCKGKQDEHIVLKRTSRSSSRFSQNNIFEALLEDITKYTNGDLLTIEDQKYFVVARRDSYLSKIAQLYKCNTTIDIVRLAKEYINGNYTGKSIEQLLYSDVPAIYQDITGHNKQFEPGILDTSTRKFIIPKLIHIQQLDCVKFRGERMQLDTINTSQYDGLYYIQCQPDKRRVVSS